MESIKRLPTHPGDVLKEELEARGISQKQFSERTGVPYTMLNEILNGKRAVTSDFALIVEAALGINPDMMIAMQMRYNMVQSRLRPSMADRIQAVRKMCASWVL